METRLISRENAAFQVLLALRDNRQQRTKRGEIFVEGVAPINALVRARISAVAVACRSGTRLSGWASETIDSLAPQVRYELSPAMMERISDRTDPSELIVIAVRPRCRLEDVATGPGVMLVVVDRPSNPGNLGSLVRSADAFGASAVVTAGHSADPFDPRVIRASLGACFTTPVLHEPSAKRLEAWLDSISATGVRVVGTDSGGSMALPDAGLERPVALVFGNEATGLSARLRERVGQIVRVPMNGAVDSLNLACAASIVMYEVSRNRRA